MVAQQARECKIRAAAVSWIEPWIAPEPDEIAPSFVFFVANRFSSFYTGEVIAPVGGETMPG